MDAQTLVLAAFEPELKPLRTQFQDAPSLSFSMVGIGSIEAAASLSRLLATSKFKKVLFVGSVGCHDTKIPLQSFVCATSSMLIDAALVNEQSYLPAPYIREYHGNTSLILEIKKAVPIALFEPIASTPSITSDAALAAKYWSSTGSRFENLELFGIATTCAAFSIPWASLCAVTNHTGPEAHEQWKNNHVRAAEITAAAIAALLANERSN